jgi:hypothetical protein
MYEVLNRALQDCSQPALLSLECHSSLQHCPHSSISSETNHERHSNVDATARAWPQMRKLSLLFELRSATWHAPAAPSFLQTWPGTQLRRFRGLCDIRRWVSRHSAREKSCETWSAAGQFASERPEPYGPFLAARLSQQRKRRLCLRTFERLRKF